MQEGTSTKSQPALADLSSETLLGLGDSYYVDENYEEAVDTYAAALSLFRDSEVVLRIRTLSHRSIAFYKLQRYEEALDDAEDSLLLLSTKKPGGLRAGEGEICHFRAGLAAYELKKYQEAKTFLQKAAQLASLNNRRSNKETYENLLQKCNTKLSAPHQTPRNETSSSASEESTSKTCERVASESATVAKVTKPTVPTQPNAAARSTSSLAGSKGEAPKYQYYQTDKVMTISILETSVRQQDLNVQFEPKHLLVVLRKNGTDFTVIAGNLFSEIDIEKSKVVFKEEKVLIKLRKVEHYEWHELLGKGDDNSTNTINKTTNDNSDADEAASPKTIPSLPKDESKSRPYASHRDWDAIERDIAEEEKKEKPEGDEAMNKLFKQIYSNASDDTRRAMVKSFQTSGGTVLSTNWDEVKNKDYEKERTAPKGVEWKTWDGEKVPMKEDN